MVLAGRALLVAAAVSGVAAALLLWWGRGPRHDRAGRVALVVGAASVAAAFVLLARAFVTVDLTLAAVAGYTRRDVSWPYRLAGTWAGMGGSLLLWTTFAWVAAAAVGLRRAGALGGETEGYPPAQPVGARAGALLAGLAGAFAGVTLWLADPFATLDLPAVEGSGMTPILEHPAMVVHPPVLYVGLISALVPLALAVAGRPVASLVRAVRLSWTALAAGMLLGAVWAYVELGWGGFWAWDPVENAALMPWLALTVALHAAHRPVASRRAHVVRWAVGAGLLALMGTVLTRSGATSSVHAFAEARAVGWSLLAVALVVAAIATPTLLGTTARGEVPGSTAPPDEGGAMVDADAPAVRWTTDEEDVPGPSPGSDDAVAAVGTTPATATATGARPALASEVEAAELVGLVGGAEPPDAPPAGPDGGVVPTPAVPAPISPRGAASLVSSVVPVGDLRDTGPSSVDGPTRGPGQGAGWRERGTRVVDLTAASLGLVLVVVVVGTLWPLVGRLTGGDPSAVEGSFFALFTAPFAAFGVAAMVVVTVTRRRHMSVASLVGHLGAAVLLVGVAGTTLTTSVTAGLDVGGSTEVAGWVVRNEGVHVEERGRRQVVVADLALERDGRTVATMHPSLVGDPVRGTLLAETVLRSRPVEDVQIALRRADDDGRVLLEVAARPLTQLVWLGGATLVAAGVVGMASRRRGQPVT